MAEAARKIPDQQPDVLRVLRMIEGGQPEKISLEAAALRLVNHVQEQIKAGVDLETMSEILNGLEALLRILPKKPIIIELFPEKEKAESPERRKGSVSEKLRVVRQELEVPKENKPAENRDPVVEPFIAEQRRLFLLQDDLKARSKKGEKVDEGLSETTRLLEENRARLQQALRDKEKPQLLSEETKAELERKMAAVFSADPEVKPPQTAEEKARWEAEKDRAVDEWLAREKKKKIPLYLHRLETSKIVAEAVQVLEEVHSREDRLRGETRRRILESLVQMADQKTVPAFLKTARTLLGDFVSAFAERKYEPDEPLFPLGNRIVELHRSLPTPEQIDHSGFTRAQMHKIQRKIERCLLKLAEDPEEKVEKLLDEIQRKGMNPARGPNKLRIERAKEHRNDEKLQNIFRAKKSRREGRNKW